MFSPKISSNKGANTKEGMELEHLDEKGQPLDYKELVKNIHFKIVEKEIKTIIHERQNSPPGFRR